MNKTNYWPALLSRLEHWCSALFPLVSKTLQLKLPAVKTLLSVRLLSRGNFDAMITLADVLKGATIATIGFSAFLVVKTDIAAMQRDVTGVVKILDKLEDRLNKLDVPRYNGN